LVSDCSWFVGKPHLVITSGLPVTRAEPKTAIPIVKSPVAVEKLLPVKFAKIKLRQDALETTFLIFWTLCIPQILAVWEETGLFQHPRLFATVGRSTHLAVHVFAKKRLAASAAHEFL
jgi:hypothetical protein